MASGGKQQTDRPPPQPTLPPMPFCFGGQKEARAASLAARQPHPEWEEAKGRKEEGRREGRKKEGLLLLTFEHNPNDQRGQHKESRQPTPAAKDGRRLTGAATEQWAENRCDPRKLRIDESNQYIAPLSSRTLISDQP